MESTQKKLLVQLFASKQRNNKMRIKAHKNNWWVTKAIKYEAGREYRNRSRNTTRYFSSYFMAVLKFILGNTNNKENYPQKITKGIR